MFAPRQPDDQVEVDRPRRQLRDRLVGRVVGRDLDLGRELLLELLDGRRVEVVGVVVDPQRAGLGLDAVLDRLVLVGDRPGDGVVRARQRQPARTGRLLDDELGGRAAGAGGVGADRGGRVLAGRQAGDDPRAGDRPGGSAGELAPGDTGSILGMRCLSPPSGAFLAGRSLRPRRSRSARAGSAPRGSRRSGVVTWLSSAPSTKFVIISAVSHGLGQPGALDQVVEAVHVGDRPAAGERAQVLAPAGLEHQLVLRGQEGERVVDLRVGEPHDPVDQLGLRRSGPSRR